MLHPRIQDAPEHLEAEARILADEFFAQFDDDEIIPKEAYGEYLKKHGSKELVRYLIDTFGA